jgi:hypothetical protein
MFLARVIFHPYCQYIQTDPLIPTHFRYRQLSHLTTLNDTHTITVGITPLEEWSAKRRDLSLTTLTRDIHFPGRIRTRNSTRPAATDLRLRPRGHRDLSVDCVWNVMVHAHRPDLVFRRNGRVHLNRKWRQFSRLLAAEVCASAVVMLDAPRSEVV